MCLLCSRAFYDFSPRIDQAKTEKERLLREAASIKLEIEEAERVVRAGERDGTPCAVSVSHLADLKKRQYEISQKI